MSCAMEANIFIDVRFFAIHLQLNRMALRVGNLKTLSSLVASFGRSGRYCCAILPRGITNCSSVFFCVI